MRLLALWICVSLAVAPSVALADPPVEVTARVVELPRRIIPCGILAFRAVVRYEVISVEQGTFRAKELFAVELCPELLRLGMQRRLTLLRPARERVHDELARRPGTRWEVRSR